jgi:cytoskeletal protein CcmA (bactofilin family)
MVASYKVRVLSLVVLWVALSTSLAQQAGEMVRLRGSIAEDVYAAGGTVDIMASVKGDVVAAGGRVTVRDVIVGDVMAAGGAVTVYAEISDDVRVVGGDVTLSGTVGGDAVAAAGNVTITSDSKIGGRVWLSGGHIDVAGAIGKELRAAGGRIMLSGRVDGNVELAGNRISILDGTTIAGNLSYRSPREADIANGAQIQGSIDYEPVEQPFVAVGAAVAATGIVALLSFAVTGVVLFLLFPRAINASVAIIRTEFWKCLGLGLAIFAATPVVIFVLLMTVIGWLPAVVIGPIYVILLLAGFLTAVFYIGDLSLGLFRRGEPSTARRLWSFALALIVVTVLGLVPVLGAFLLFVLMLLGVGVLNLWSYRTYVAQPGV